MFRLDKLVAVAFVLVSTMTPVLAGQNCTCRFKGQDVVEGQIICMDLPSGQVLAQCSRVLNNTAWQTLQKGCPYGKVEVKNMTEIAG